MPATLALTCVAMLAFAANSLLARAALAGGAIDAVSFTTIRFAAGALTLAALLLTRHGRGGARASGNWASALCLFVYGMGFSLAYLRLGAATGALILFAAVQAGMIGWGLYRGQRPGLIQTAGLVIAALAFVALMLPGLQAPNPLGAVLMMAAGLAWAGYSVRGRSSTEPLADTAGNFARATVLCAPIAIVFMRSAQMGTSGIVLAVLSGAVASGLGYAIWYRALPGLKPVPAASVQLTVPLIAALGAVLLLGEALTLRLVLAGSCILFGVGMTILAGPNRRA